jgi:hypothetical protein
MKHFSFRQNAPLICAIVICLYVFSNWFISPVNLGNDFNFVNYDHFRVHSIHPYIWDLNLGNGFGQYAIFTLPFFFYSFTIGKIAYIIQDSFLLHKLIFLIPLLTISIISIVIATKKFIHDKWGQAITALLYIINPYFIMLTSGGQIGVAFAYAFSPLLIAYAYTILIRAVNWNQTEKMIHYTLFGLALAILISFDTRIALLVNLLIFVMVIGFLITSKQKVEALKKYFLWPILTYLVVVGFHMFWLLPSVFVNSVSLPSGYDSSNAVTFFSFARFAHAITWTHPNYPENIFGVVKEVSGFAFIFPVLAFLIIKQKRKIVVFFAITSIVAAFLIKGTNEPFGEIYKWLFNTIPAFNWFRDSTKFFVLLSIAYSFLIGLSVQEFLKEKSASNVKKLLFVISALCIIITWWPTLNKNIGGTLAYQTYPAQHKEIEKILTEDKSFGRVLWVPQRDIYGFSSLNHPQVLLKDLRIGPSCHPTLCIKHLNAPEKKEFTKQDLLNEIDQLTAFLSDTYSQTILQELGINYIILTPDTEKNIYIFDKKYDDSIKQYYKNKLENITWMNKIENSQNLEIYKTRNQSGLFTSRNSIGADILPFTMKNPTEFEIDIRSPGQPITFTQSYSNRWTLHQDGTTTTSIPNKFGMNEFPTNNTKQGKAKVSFRGQDFATAGFKLSLATIVLTIGIGVIYLLKKKEIRKLKK